MDAACTGRLGEDLALLFYQHNGYTCEARRWRRAGGEADLVLTRPGQLVFVEVKTRGVGSLGRAVESVPQRQLHRLRMIARHWCHERGGGGRECRLDVVTVDLAGEGRGLILRHFPDQ